MGNHGEAPAPLTVDANEDFIFLFGGVETQRWGGGVPLPPARLGEEVPADSRPGLSPCESTPLPAHACWSSRCLFVLDPS